MPLSMYQASAPIFVTTLNNLAAILKKGGGSRQGAQDRGKRAARLWFAPDMYPLTRQVQLATDFAKGATARLAAAEVPKYADDEASFPALEQRIAKTVTFIESFRPADIDGSEERDITLTVGGQGLRFKGQPYLLHFALPNFYFHVTTAYDLLRACGVAIGKRDYLGAI